MLMRFACNFKIKYCALPCCLSSLLLHPLPLTPLSGNNSVETRFNMQIYSTTLSTFSQIANTYVHTYLGDHAKYGAVYGVATLIISRSICRTVLSAYAVGLSRLSLSLTFHTANSFVATKQFLFYLWFFTERKIPIPGGGGVSRKANPW